MKHFMRRGDPLDEFVGRLVVARLSRGDALDLLTPRVRPDVKALRDERRRLETRRREVGSDAEAGLLPRDEELAALKRIAKRIAEIDELLRAGVNVSAFSDVVGAADVQAAWESRPLGVKREIVDALMTMTVHSVGQGNRRKMSDEQLAKTVTIEWRE
ncbi:hypothetical protein [Herbiconiux daphne]|uniref:Uncharacterized protein n=1 Tax=Herbiconiux daphne TaxID=2970914 RepID=A0ABT2H6F2_9MICO|nr:hypothetical protein [Herbiconiux daphne]MCS5735515.1 hypothetical protein [Herbiconiux daphne]